MKHAFATLLITLLACHLAWSQAPAPERYTEFRRQTLPTDDPWWNSFNDSTLNFLISSAVDNNLDALMAFRRIRLANLALAQTRSAYYPSISLSAGWDKERLAGPVDDSSFNLGLSLSWQIDVFGRVYSQSKAKKAAWRASRADYAATMVTLCGNVAKAYVDLRAYQAQLEIARNHLISQEKVLNITQARFDCGLASELDVQQAKTIFASTQASIPSLEASIHSYINSLALYLAVDADVIAPKLANPSPLPNHLKIIRDSLPIDLIRRRPDVVEAEQLVAENADNIGIAKKDYLPVLSLSANVGTQAHNIGRLFSSNSFTYSIAPTLSWTLFSGFSRRYAVESARENMQIAINNYNLTLLQAVNEADNAKFAYDADIKQIAALEDAARAADESLSLAIDRYKQGLSDFTNVADAQISLLNYSNEVIQARAQALNSLISLYEALGGGWSPDF